MKIIVFSDSHGTSKYMESAILEEQPDQMFFLGDGLSDLRNIQRHFPHLHIDKVRGNCDISASYTEDTVYPKIAGISFMLTHGHRYGVKRDLHDLLDAALANNIDVVCFGHTHQPLYSMQDHLQILNPGSIGIPNIYTYSYTYAVITISEGSSVSCTLRQINK